MSSDRSWTIAPTLLWFTGCAVVAMCVIDGGPRALADRFTPRKDPAAAAAGPAFTAPPPEVADASDDDPRPAPPRVAVDRSKILELADVCVEGTPAACKRWAMDGFYRAVADAKRGALGRAVRVSWYGDSVIATDAIPGHLRTLLQGELGDGGPGFVYAVPPHRFCGHDAITRWQTGTWNTHAITTSLTGDGLYGVGGSTAETEDGRATIRLNAGTASQIELYYLAQPHGGTATVLGDGVALAEVATRADKKQAGYATATAKAAGVKRVELATSGRVRVFGLALENASGAVVDNLGVVSVNVKSFDVNNAEHFTGELAHRGADLILIMIGANEAQWLGPTDYDTKHYAEHYDRMLSRVRAARPQASCLVVSPTDQAEAKDGEYPSRPVMPILIAAQREAARAAGCAFYSTYDWMGGKGSAAKWFRKGYVGTDFQHLSRKGASKLAEAVYEALMTGYRTYAAK